MLFRFSRIKFSYYFLLGMATVSALLLSPLAAVKVLANDRSSACPHPEFEQTQEEIPERLNQQTIRIELRFSSKKEYTNNNRTIEQECAISTGSGTIIHREELANGKYRYTALTVDHNFQLYNTFLWDFNNGEFVTPEMNTEGEIVANVNGRINSINLIAHNHERYPLTNENVTRLRDDQIYGLDLAVVTFESNVKYEVATLAPLPEGESHDIRIQEEQLVTVTGWPTPNLNIEEKFKLLHNSGIINPHNNYDYLGTRDETYGGYVMGYNATTRGGVSGGPVFDTQGRLIAVHGLGIAIGPSNPQDLTDIIGKTVPGGIPINTFTDQLPGSTRRLENRNSLFDRLPTNLINLITMEASLPVSTAGNETIANNPSQSVDTYFEQAAEHWKNALAASNNFPGAGCVAECREEAEKALAQYDEALKIINNEPSRVRARALVFRGIVHQLLGNSSKKESDWEEASQIVQAGGEPLAYVWLGNTLYRWGYKQKAEELWDQAVNLANSDDNADVYLEIGKFLIENGRREEGREYWNRLINSLPENSVIRRKIAAEYAYFAKPHLGYNDFAYGEAALEQAQEAVNINPNAYSYYDLARIQADLGDPESAKATLEQAANNCGESICGTLIEDKRQEIGVVAFSPLEQEENQETGVASSPSGSLQIPDQSFVTPQPATEPDTTGPTFFCNDANRQTMRQTQPLINWESREFGWQYQPDNRCTYVSNRLESYETQGLLAQIDRITHGVMNNYSVLCIATDEAAANARNCIGGQLIVTLGSIDRTSIQEAEAALAEFKAALRDPNYVGPPLDNIKGVKGVSKPK